MSICFCGTLDACLRLAMLRLISTPLAARGLIGSVFCEIFLFVGCTAVSYTHLRAHET